MEGNKPEFKAIIVGGDGVGKSSIVSYAVNNMFCEDLQKGLRPPEINGSTIKVEVYGQPVKLHVWDCNIETINRRDLILDTENFCEVFRNAKAVIVVYDSCIEKSFSEALDYLYSTVDRLRDGQTVYMVVANKIDKTTERIIFLEEAEKYTGKNQSLYHVEICAETGQGVIELFEMIAKQLLHQHLPESVPKSIPSVEKSTEQNKLSRAKQLQQNLNKAKKQHGSLPVRFIKLFFTGSGAAGKTSFVNLLLKKKINKDHHSTNVAHSNHAVSVTMAAFQGSPNSVRWVELGSDIEISFLKSVLLPKESTSSLPAASTQQHTKQAMQPSAINLKSVDSQSQLVKHSYKHPVQQEVSLMQRISGLFVKSVKGSRLSTFQTILDSTPTSAFTHQPGEVLNIITLLDTGGQPQYIHLLPTINIYPTVTFVVHDLSKSLDDQVLVEYSEHGKHMFTPYHLSYSNRDMIKLLMSSANDAAERSPNPIPHLATTAGLDTSSYICLVGTHADKVAREVIKHTADQLGTLVDQTQCKASVWQTQEGSVLFSADNTTAGNQQKEDPVADLIRSRIEALAAEKDVYELPITWMLLELEIRQVCVKSNKLYISFNECFALARDTGLISDKEEVRSVLQYHHQLGTLIHFAEVPGLCNYVITDHQWWFDKLSSIICVTFKQSSHNRQAVQKLKYDGLFSKDLLQHIEWEDDIKKDCFISLLVCMKIIAPVKREQEEYFMPFVLPTFTSQQADEILPQYGHLLGQPLLVQLKSGILPRGLFCCLIVELLQHSPKGWHPHFSHDGVHHTFSNLITFSLPDGYSLSLLDKVSYLEVQMRHINNTSPSPVLVKAYNYLVYALTEVCIHLNFDYERLQYGFLCQCGKATEDHIAVLPETPSSATVYAECSINSVHRTKLSASQLMWFLHEEQSPVDNGADLQSCLMHPSANQTQHQRVAKKPTFADLLLYLEDVGDWEVLGAHLLPAESAAQIAVIDKTHRGDVAECKISLFQLYLRVGDVSWSTVITALRKAKYPHIAQKIQNDFL